MHAATFFDGVEWREGVVEVVDGRVRLRDELPRPDLPRLDGVVTGGFTDHHVHLQLVDHGLLAGSRLGRVVDLGGNPTVLRELTGRFVSLRSLNDHPRPPSEKHHDHPRPSSDEQPRSSSDDHPRPPSDERPRSSSEERPRSLSEERSDETKRPVRIDFAGAFLTPPGGYPSDRGWAPEGSVREIADIEAAATAVAEMADAGASAIKVASNSSAGPVFSDELFRAITGLAAARGLPVVAHAEGPGEAQRVVRLGAARLAHTPFTERLDDDEIAYQAASVSWISTLAIHGAPERTVAVDNLHRFHAAGGTVLYGTDMGNGPTPVDLDPGEIAALREAGLDDDTLLRALAPLDLRDPSSPLLLLPRGSARADGLADPLDARPLTPADLKV